MRVIAGSAKGHPLVAPDGLNTRPITDKIKGALFNSWQMDIPGCAFLDLFAGSGSMGIEALSRGAKSVAFVEKDRKAIQAIRQNLAKCKFTSGYEVYQDDVFRQIERMSAQEHRFDIIYLERCQNQRFWQFASGKPTYQIRNLKSRLHPYGGRHISPRYGGD